MLIFRLAHCIRVIQLIVLCFFLTVCIQHNPSHENISGALRIHDIQGCSHQSPYNGQEISGLEGIVTRKSSNGFYIQDSQIDDLACSSEAIFVYTGTFSDVMPGDFVSISGVVDEYQAGTFQDHNLTITQIIEPGVRVLESRQKLPDAVVIGEGGLNLPDKVIDDDGFSVFDPAQDGIDFYESLESMLVTIESGVIVGPRNAYNEIVIIPDHYRAKNLVSTAGALVAQEFDFNPERILFILNHENQEEVHTGYILAEEVTGILDYSYGNYKVNVFGLGHFTGDEPEVPIIENSEEPLSILSYNVENLSRFDESRIRDLARSISGILDHPDLLILNEILDDSGVEDDGVVTADLTLQMLVEEIAAQRGVHYNYIDNPPDNNQDGGIYGGNIRSVILYKQDKLALTKLDLRELAANPLRIGLEEGSFSATRKPLVALFEYEGEQFLVAALHLTSRGVDSPLFGNVQPIERPEEQKRIAQAAYVHQFLARFNEGNPEIPILVVGDINDDPWSTTLETMSGDLLVDTGNALSKNERFSFILDGNGVQLDYILFSSNSDWLYSQEIVHLNTVFDTTRQMSDHDPVITIFQLP